MPDEAAHPLPHPLLVFDGDCGFCRHHVLRWRRILGDRVEFIASQDLHAKYPGQRDVQRDYASTVWLLEPGGRDSRGAAAVFRALSLAGRGGLLWCYRYVPGFAAVTELGYRFVAGHRVGLSRLTRLFVGPEPPTYAWSSWLFLRLLALVFAIAFGSAWGQLPGLVGSHGLLPIGELLERAHNVLGDSAWTKLPTLLWFGHSDGALHALCAAGVALSIVCLLGVAQRVCLIGLWVLYLSLTVAGNVFLSFQWDVLLLETGFLAIFLAPGSIRPRGPVQPSGAALLLLRWLLFRLMFLSGLVKLTSGDPSWGNLTALSYHYWTQPLPLATSHHMSHMGSGFHAVSALVMFAIELGLPFFALGPRRLKLVAATGISSLMVAIALTGNYGFFNLLTVVLCVPLIDDATLRRVMPRSLRELQPSKPPVPSRWRARVWAGFVAVMLFLSTARFVSGATDGDAIPEPVESVLDAIAPFRSINNYGLFRVMTKERPEIEIDASMDGKTWKPYRFRWKPGDVHTAPREAGFYMPRLDWQMWFAALRGQPPYWFAELLERLLAAQPEVLALLAESPFGDTPPRYVRARLWKYRFSSPEAKDSEGIWWTRELVGTFFPPVMLEDGELVPMRR